MLNAGFPICAILNIVKEAIVSHRSCVSTICGLLVAVCAGCGDSAPKLYPVSGSIIFEDKPVEGASVVFIPQQGAPSVGTTDASGKYTIATRGQPGAPAGAYSVTVSKQSGTASVEAAPTMPQRGDAEPSEEEKQKMMQKQQASMEAMAKMMQGGATPKNLLPAQYAVPGNKYLTATVTADASKNVFDFKLAP